MNKVRKKIIDRVKGTISEQRRQNEGLSMIATTKGQLRLQSKHGTPYDFAKACIDCIGEISVDEAREAINKYQLEWEAAK